MKIYLIGKMIFLFILCGALLAQSPQRRVHIQIHPDAKNVDVNATPDGVIVNGQRAANVTSTDVERILARFIALEEAVLKLTEAMNKASGNPAPTPKPKPKPKPEPTPERDPPTPELLLIFARSCVQCHTPDLAEEQGGGFVMYDGPKVGTKIPKLRKLSPESWVAIDYSVYSGDMPKFGDPLPSDESAEIRAYVNSIRDEVYSAIRSGTR